MKTKTGIEKPLAEWTLAEAKEYCENLKKCLRSCPFDGVCSKILTEWKLGNEQH